MLQWPNSHQSFKKKGALQIELFQFADFGINHSIHYPLHPLHTLHYHLSLYIENSA